MLLIYKQNTKIKDHYITIVSMFQFFLDLVIYVIPNNINNRITKPAKYPYPYSVNLTKSNINIFRILKIIIALNKIQL